MFSVLRLYERVQACAGLATISVYASRQRFLPLKGERPQILKLADRRHAHRSRAADAASPKKATRTVARLALSSTNVSQKFDLSAAQAHPIRSALSFYTSFPSATPCGRIGGTNPLFSASARIHWYIFGSMDGQDQSGLA